MSGLGVDHRTFRNIIISNAEMINVPWIPPRNKESLKEYAHRLFESISPEQDTIYIGVSFGGMIAQEWALIQAPK